MGTAWLGWLLQLKTLLALFDSSLENKAGLCSKPWVRTDDGCNAYEMIIPSKRQRALNYCKDRKVLERILFTGG